jgi:hypothetical protein
MKDHGLFVAGVVNTVAPEATMHLINVFTTFGSASTMTITRGLTEVAKKLSTREIKPPLVVNCSFALSIDDDSHLPAEILELTGYFEKIFHNLASQEGVLIVAAAGNYIKRLGPARPDASYPAAFADVIGVGALSKTFQVASYSNLADDPPAHGYMALGGEPGVGNGVLGIYTSEFPVYAEGCLGLLLRILSLGLLGWKGAGYLPTNPYTHTSTHIRYRPNTTGWAWWAGTSFAAPVVTAILAKWCSQQVNAGRRVNLADARRALTDMSQTATTRQNEHVIIVEQG